MSDVKAKLAALKDAFNKKVSSPNANWKLFYPFWKIPVDSTATVRFLPDADSNNPLLFLVEKLEHKLVVNGNEKSVACLQMFGESCPICDLSRKYYEEEGDGSTLGQKYYRKKSYIGQVIVIESPIEHDQTQLVKLVEFGPQVFKQIQAAFKTDDFDAPPYEYKGGYNFRFRKTQTGDGRNSYTTSSFAPKQTDLDDELIEALKLFNLSDYRGEHLDSATIQALITADQTGRAFSESAATPAAHAVSAPVQPKPTITQPTPAVTTTVTPSQPAVEAQPVASKANSVLEQLRARAKAAQQTESAS